MSIPLAMDFLANVLFPVSNVTGEYEGTAEHNTNPKGSSNSKYGYCIVA